MPSEINGQPVAAISDYAFSQNKKIKSIQLGTVSQLGYRFLDGCIGITEITIPKTVTDAYCALESSSVKIIYFESGMKTIPNNIAYNCTALKTVYLPDSVSEIGDYSFAGCNNLEKVYSNLTSFKFSAHSFEDCEKFDDSRFTVFDPENTYLITNSEQANINGIINYTLKYKMMPSVAKNADNIALHINIPDELTLLLDSIQSRNISFGPEDINDGVIYVDSTEGELRFSVRVTEVGDYQVSAAVNFEYNDAWWEQPIGKLDVECPDITCCSLEKTNNFEINVYGIADKGSKVEIYVDDKLIDTATSNSYTGKYSASIKLPHKETGAKYCIYAKSNNIESKEIYVEYVENHPAVKAVYMIYNDHEDERTDITNVFTEGVSPVINYNPAYPVIFEIETDHTEQIYKLFVISQKGNIEKKIEAFWNEDRQLWITKDYFDENNHNYVPGSLNIGIQTFNNTAADQIPSEFNIKPDENIAANSSSEIIEKSDDETYEKVIISDGEQSEEIYHYISTTDTIIINDQEVSAKEVVKEPQKYGYTFLPFMSVNTNGKPQQCYVKPICGNELKSNIGDKYDEFADLYGFSFFIDDEFVSELWQDVVPSFIIEKVVGETAAKTYDTIGSFVSLGSALSHYYQNYSNASDANGRALARMMYAYSSLSLVGGMLVSSINPVAGLLWSITTGLVGTYLQDMLDKYYKNCGHIRWIIDPSGIVFEAVMGNPVEGATVTVYFKDTETNQTIKWNAEDYDQLNPLLTDSEGKYLWDVPEGEWKVVCEKEGYETVETDWMKIPPVRTDVNISLVNKDAPKLVSADIENDSITIKFSKFVNINTVNAKSIIINEFNGVYSIKPLLLNENDIYADTFIISGNLTNNIRAISATSDVVSYAGVPANTDEFTLTNSQTPTSSATTTTTSTTTTSTTTTTTTSTTTISSTTTTSTTTTTTSTTTTTTKPTATSSTTTTTATPTQPIIKLGDVNNDNIVDARDASAVLREYALSSTQTGGSFTTEQKQAADVNGDNIVDARDASMILAFYAQASTENGEQSIENYIKKLK